MQNKTNITTGKKFTTPENYKGINTPYFSAGDYEERKKFEEGNARAFFKKGISFKKERSLLEFLGREVTLEIKEIKTLFCEKEEIRPDGTPEKYEEETPFLVMSFVGGRKEYYFRLNGIMQETLVSNGLLPDREEEENAPVQEFPYTEEEIFSIVGKRVKGYFYYTTDAGKGKKLFATCEKCQAYHSTIQARFERENVENASDQKPQEQEREN